MVRARLHISILAVSFPSIGGLLAPAMAGDLFPPVGPVAPTMKTLVEVEPRIIVNAINTPGDFDSMFVITAPGSYYLVDNIMGIAGFNGIKIDSDAVTLDLMGFHMIGVPGSLAGVAVPIDHTNICIRNGSVCGWGEQGVSALLAVNSELHDLRACSNGLTGLVVGPGSTVRNCTGESNGGSGVFAGMHSSITHSVGRLNADFGVASTAVATVSFCAGFQNGDAGVAAGYGSTISYCVAEQNGFAAVPETSAPARSKPGASEPALLQVELLNGPRGGDRGVTPFVGGIVGGGTCTIIGCSATTNAGNGILMLGGGGTISNCTSSFNSTNGIAAGFETSILDCKVSDNIDDGVEVGVQCVVTRTLATDNDDDLDGLGAGIHAIFDGNQIEDNRVIENAVGILVDMPGNLIMRNRATLNPAGAYVFVPGNAAAPFVVVAAIDPFFGVDPNANLEY